MNGRRVVATLLLAAGLVGATEPSAPATRDALAIPQAERRGGDQTYLTFPEWFLVFSPDEYADMLQAAQSPSRFPFFAHVGQFWQAYGRVADAVRGRWAFNGEYHTMIAVIGASTTVEYVVKGTYETLVGRLAELGTPALGTPEDRLAAQQARDYVDFIRVRPWYEFDFLAPLRTLWRDTPWTGPHLLRKWERRYLLSSEWLAKAGYAALIARATHASFEAAAPTTAVVVDDLPDGVPQVDVRRRDGRRALASLPRYQAFTDAATRLALRGGRFVDIAGNRGDVLVSLVAPSTAPLPSGTRLLARQPVLTRPGYERRLVATDVAGLAPLLVGESARGGVEHVFDY